MEDYYSYRECKAHIMMVSTSYQTIWKLLIQPNISTPTRFMV